MRVTVQFRKCTLKDQELIEKIDGMTDQIFIKKEVPLRYFPGKPNEDYDLLVGELIMRFIDLQQEYKENC